LRVVKDLPRMIRRILLYGGRRELKSADGVEIWPLDHFLAALESDGCGRDQESLNSRAAGYFLR
jgi:hypothetical protein